MEIKSLRWTESMSSEVEIRIQIPEIRLKSDFEELRKVSFELLEHMLVGIRAVRLAKDSKDVEKE